MSISVLETNSSVSPIVILLFADELPTETKLKPPLGFCTKSTSSNGQSVPLSVVFTSAEKP